MTLIGWVSGYQVGKRSADKWWQVHGPTYDYPAYGHQTLKWYANPIPYDNPPSVETSIETKSACVKAGECQPTNYWTICDDGYVRFGKAIVDDDLKVKACGLHGAVDTRRIHISSTEGKDWKVIVTPINPKGKLDKLEDQK